MHVKNRMTGPWLLQMELHHGSLSVLKEHMGASFIVVEKLGSAVLLQFSTPVGGPLAKLPAEAIGLFNDFFIIIMSAPESQNALR